MQNTLEHSRPALLWLQVICWGTSKQSTLGHPVLHLPLLQPPCQVPLHRCPKTLRPLKLQLSCQGILCAKSPGLCQPMPTSAPIIPPGLPHLQDSHNSSQPASQNHQVLQSTQGMIIHETISSSLFLHRNKHSQAK